MDVQRVRDRPAGGELGTAETVTERPAARKPVRVLDPEGKRVGEISDAAPGYLDIPTVVVGLDETVRAELGLTTKAVDIESRFLERKDEGTVQLIEPLPHVLRAEGFEV